MAYISSMSGFNEIVKENCKRDTNENSKRDRKEIHAIKI